MGRYDVVLPLASGGMATVYLARSYGAGGFGREVALKLMHAHLREAPEFAQSLLAEARLMVSIRHPNVVPVLDVGDDPRGLFLVMDLVEGDTVGGLQKRARQEGRPIPPPIQARLLLDALAGLHAAHESRAEDGRSHEMVHRDFSPQNLLVGLDGVTRLTDFGIARASTQLVHTTTGLVKGKASYMAPEQARGLPLDRRCDVWAAGVVAWELIADRRLFRADNDLATVVRVLGETAPRLDEVGAAGAVADAVERALRPEVDERWPTAAAFRAALLEAFRAGGGVAEHDEVAAFVASLIGDRLAARREEAAAVLRARRRPTEVERDGLPEPASGPLLAAAPPAPSPPAPSPPAGRSPWSWRHGAALLAALAAALAGHGLRRAGAGASAPLVAPEAAPSASAAPGEPAASAASARAGEAGGPSGVEERGAGEPAGRGTAGAATGERAAGGPIARGAGGRAGATAPAAAAGARAAPAPARAAARGASPPAATLAPSPYGGAPR